MALSDVGFGGFFRGEKAGDVGAGGGDGGLLGGDGGGGLDVFHGGEDGAGFDVVAFLDVEVGDAAEGGGSDVDVGLGLDLAGAVDDGDEVLAGGFAGGDLGNAGLSVEDAADDDSGQNQDDCDDDDDLFSAHCCFLRTAGRKPEVLWTKLWAVLRDNTYRQYGDRWVRVPYFPAGGSGFSLDTWRSDSCRNSRGDATWSYFRIQMMISGQPIRLPLVTEI